MSAPARTRPARTRPTHPKSSPWTKPKLVASRPQHAPGRGGPRRAPFVLLIAGLLIGGLCMLLALNTAAAAEELRRHALSQSNADLSDDVQQLQARLAARQAPAALASAAAKLGMVPAGNPAFLSVAPDGKVKVLGDPQPATAAPPPPAPSTSTPQATPVAKKTKPATRKTTPAPARSTSAGGAR